MGANPVKSRNIELFPKKLWIHNSANYQGQINNLNNILTNECMRNKGSLSGTNGDDLNDFITTGIYTYGGDVGLLNSVTDGMYGIYLVFRSVEYVVQMFFCGWGDEHGKIAYRFGHTIRNNKILYWVPWRHFTEN